MLPEQTRGLFDAHRSIHTSVLTESAALVADTSRATMLTTLLDGRAYTAKELACAALVSAATASFHLRKLRQSGLILGVSQGRHRFFRLASDEVARILEGLLSLQPPLRVNAVTNRCPPHLRQARCCYNHIAGRLGVGIYRVFPSQCLDRARQTRLAIDRPRRNALGCALDSGASHTAMPRLV
jgi:DNA-binding transcriptional ArsR family regulator